MPTALVTGGAGFVGSHLVDALLAAGYRVRVLDDLSTGRRENLAHLPATAPVECVWGDCTTNGLLAAMMQDVDVVFHLAATVGVLRVLDQPLAAATNNLHATQMVLAIAERHGARVVLASTSEVYGDRTPVPFREDQRLAVPPPTQPRWIYACAKLMDEFLALAYWRERGVPVVVARLFNTIGPRQRGRYGMVVPRFLGQALTGRALTVYGTGEQARCFTYVADTVRWLLLLGSDDRAVGKVFNLGNDADEVSIGTLARRVLDVTGSASPIEFRPYQALPGSAFTDVVRRVPSIEKVVALTGHAPAVGLDEALRRTGRWLADELATASAPERVDGGGASATGASGAATPGHVPMAVGLAAPPSAARGGGLPYR